MRFLSVGAFALAFMGFEPLTPASFGQTICGQYDNVATKGGRYRVQTNEWNSKQRQCLTANGGSFTVSTASFNLPNGAPASAPSIYQGCHWGTCTTGSKMPVQVRAIGTATASVTLATTPGHWNAALDVWFNQTPATKGNPDGIELMIWLNHEGFPRPAGAPAASIVLDGINWDVWIGNRVITYLRQTLVTSANLDLVPFIRDAMARQQIDPSWYLIGIEAGFEIWVGGQGLGVTSFNTKVSATRGREGPLAKVTPMGLPAITSIRPGRAIPGSTITIKGLSFGPTQGSSMVTFGGTPAEITSWSDNQIVAKVPKLPAGQQNIAVQVSSNPAAFWVAGESALSCHVDYAITSKWADGFQATITMANKGPAAIDGWTLKWSFDSDQQITGLVNGNLSQIGRNVTVTSFPYNGTIEPGASYHGLGFEARGTGMSNPPSSFSLNGVDCR